MAVGSSWNLAGFQRAVCSRSAGHSSCRDLRQLRLRLLTILLGPVVNAPTRQRMLWARAVPTMGAICFLPQLDQDPRKLPKWPIWPTWRGYRYHPRSSSVRVHQVSCSWTFRRPTDLHSRVTTSSAGSSDTMSGPTVSRKATIIREDGCPVGVSLDVPSARSCL